VRAKKKQTDCVSEFLQRTENTVERRHLFARGQKILVAVSGGADSMVLLHVLNSLAKKNRWQISIAHFNHQLRGRASDGDEKLVRTTAKNLQLKFFGVSADVKAFATQSKLSIEMAARKLRHEFLARVAREQKIPVVALAHHADDQVELFFLRLLRGAGGEGLAGMKWCSPSPVDKGISLVRPLLGFSKAEILSIVRANKISFRDDATNAANDFLRNRIRNELLPLLRKKYQPAVDKTVLRLMDVVGAETEFAGDVARKWLALPETKFQGLPVAVRRKVMRQQLIGLGLASDFDLVEQLAEAPGKPVAVSPDLSVERNVSGEIFRRKITRHEFQDAALKVKSSGGAGRIEFAGWKLSWALKKFAGLRLRGERAASAAPARGRSPHRAGTEFFDADKVGGEIILRHWRAGDRFQPIGMKSAVKLQDLFVNAKIPAARRRELVLAATGAGEIFWVEGLRISEQFKLTPETRRQLAWNWSKIAA
jgi:tRNA(Ile)-lysidine synthase